MFTNRFFTYPPLGMNRRNRLIRKGNPLVSLRQVKDKLGLRSILSQNGIPTPHTYNVIHDFTDLKLIPSFSDEFVVKPDRGYGGKGIILLKRNGERFVNPSKDVYSESDIKRHIRRILDGEYSGYIAQDIAIIEQRLYPSAKLQFRHAYGLPDIRIWCFQFKPVMSMLRYPTFESKGRSNLSAGGVGIGIDLATGRPTYVHVKTMTLVERRLEDLEIPHDFVIPRWEEIKEMAVKCSKIANLQMTGVDIILDSDDQIVVLEVNGRPGLEIQNINEDSILRKISP
ncbi:MAG: hypothetical protein HYX80_04320 [Chloroflexi bacterium]|nr:hypothetical protein [Chloroflexota bacterium]